MDLKCYFTLIHTKGICGSESLPPPQRWDVTNTYCKISPYLIFIPCLCILHASEGRIRESKGTKGRERECNWDIKALLQSISIKTIHQFESQCILIQIQYTHFPS